VDTRGSFPGLKRQVREANKLPPFGAEVGNGGAVLPLPHIITVLLLLDDFPTGTSLSQWDL
jgi:hypothetical protein